MTQTVAAVFAHPDDEILGCGGAMAWHADRGDRVRILILATGLRSRGTAGDEAIARLRGQAREAADIVGAETIEFADFPDNAMDSVKLLDVVQRIEAFLSEHRVSQIYTHHGGDLNIDHTIVERAVLTAVRPLPGKGSVEIRSCEVNSSTEWANQSTSAFSPTDFLDISTVLDRKVRALECYRGELRPWPHPRSTEGVRALARWRGAQSGLEAAEGYRQLRRIVAVGKKGAET